MTNQRITRPHGRTGLKKRKTEASTRAFVQKLEHSRALEKIKRDLSKVVVVTVQPTALAATAQSILISILSRYVDPFVQKINGLIDLNRKLNERLDPLRDQVCELKSERKHNLASTQIDNRRWDRLEKECAILSESLRIVLSDSQVSESVKNQMPCSAHLPLIQKYMKQCELEKQIIYAAQGLLEARDLDKNADMLPYINKLDRAVSAAYPPVKRHTIDSLIAEQAKQGEQGKS